MLHPNEREMAGALVRFVARLASGYEEPSWVVSSSQLGIAEELIQRGWGPTQRYVVLVRTLAAHVVEEPRLVAVGA
jgi:hypothetical protein